MNASSDAAELSSIATALDELASRVATIADRRTASETGDDAATGLFEAERSLRTGLRRIQQVTDRLRRSR